MLASHDHIDILKSGVRDWNKWREENTTVTPDLRGADLHGACLERADLTRANLHGAILEGARLMDATLLGANLWKAYFRKADLTRANLEGADLHEAYLGRANLEVANLKGANFRGADLHGAYLERADLTRANLHGAILEGAHLMDATLLGANFWNASFRRADLTRANLEGADLHEANLAGANLAGANLDGADLTGASFEGANLGKASFRRADLTRANLTGALLIKTDLSEAIFTNCIIYGVSAWEVNLDKATQKGLIITSGKGSIITVDDLEVAQFIHLILHNIKLRNVINTMTGKAVLIFGRFADGRKEVLESIAQWLRNNDHLPIMMDLPSPNDGNFTETVKTLAGLCKYVIADLTEAKFVPQESLFAIPNIMMPFIPLLQNGYAPWSMWKDLESRPYVLKPIVSYDTIDDLLGKMTTVIDEADYLCKAIAGRESTQYPSVLKPDASAS